MAIEIESLDELAGILAQQKARLRGTVSLSEIAGAVMACTSALEILTRELIARDHRPSLRELAEQAFQARDTRS